MAKGPNEISFAHMSEELRIELILARTTEAIECEHTEDQQRADLQAILRVPDGTPLGVNLTEDDEDVDDEDLSDVKLVDRMIDYHWGEIAH